MLQPWAFQAREFLRKKLIGKEVCFTVETKTTSGREYGVVYLGKGAQLSQNKYCVIKFKVLQSYLLFLCLGVTPVLSWTKTILCLWCFSLISDTAGENIAESLVSEGLATVRREGIRGNM